MAWRWGKRGARRRQSRVLRRRIWFGCGNLANRGMLRRKPARTRRSGGKLTWTLDALRAATEPVKEEAMQAIFVGCVLGGVQRTCAKDGADEASDAPFVPNCRFQTRPVPSRGNQIPRSDWRKPRIALDHSQISILSGTVEGLKIAFGGNRNFKDCSLVADIRSCLWPMRFR